MKCLPFKGATALAMVEGTEEEMDRTAILVFVDVKTDLPMAFENKARLAVLVANMVAFVI